MLLAVFPQGRPDATQARMVISAYVETLGGYPVWAIRQARKTMIARATPFAPSAGEMRVVCEDLVRPIREEAAQIKRILEASVEIPQEVRADTVKAIMDQFKAGLPPDDRKPASHRLPTKAEAESALADPPAHWTAPVEISEHLAAQLRGDIPIGAGNRAAPVITKDQAEAVSRMTVEELNEFAREVLR